MTHAIGIDLGTTNSCVARFARDRCDILANDAGNRTTPSVVAFTAAERLVGEAAISQAPMNSANTVFGSKRIIGRKFDDAEVQEDLKYFPFEVANQGGNPAFNVHHLGQPKLVTPEEIAAMILTKMKQTAEAYVDGDVTQVVITVPAYFNSAQRQATLDAATLAGLKVLRIINEPTAAAIAYGLDKQLIGPKTVLIFDLGGGTFDVSLVAIGNGVYQVKATAGDTHLGGEDFTHRLVDHFVDEFERKTGKSVTGNNRATRRLAVVCERLKRELSALAHALCQLDYFCDGIDLDSSITRGHFEALCYDDFKTTITLVDKVLVDAGIDKAQVDEVVLVGGSTRIPKVQEMLLTYFDGKELTKSINPDEVVAYGAAVQAAVLVGDPSPQIHHLKLMDITPLSLGIDLEGRIMAPVIPRNTPLPFKRSKMFTTSYDNQTAIEFKVFEGERKINDNNHLLGEFELVEIPPAPKGKPDIDVSFAMDTNGILNVAAVDKSTGNTQLITITHDRGRFSDDEIAQIVADAAQYREADDAEATRIGAKNRLTSLAYSLKNRLNDELKGMLTPSKYKTLNQITSKTISWLDGSQAATTTEYVNRYNKLHQVANRIVPKA